MLKRGDFMGRRKLKMGKLEAHGPGYDPQFDIYYDEMYTFGPGSGKCFIIAPKITEEERARRIREMEDTIGNVFDCECTIQIEDEYSPERKQERI
jgi:hypothetical protein